MDCLFCNIPDTRIFENQYFFSIFDKMPVSPGHALIISKRHCISAFDLTSEERDAIQEMLISVKNIIEATDKRTLYHTTAQTTGNEKSKLYCQKMLVLPFIDEIPDGYNIGNNDGEAAGRTIHHLHIHVIPRYFGDVPNPRGGIRTIIPELGDYMK